MIAAQAAVGGVVALLAWLLGGGREHAWSALYGAVTAVVPGALMARGMTSRLSSLSPVVSAASVMFWEIGEDRGDGGAADGGARSSCDR